MNDALRQRLDPLNEVVRDAARLHDAILVDLAVDPESANPDICSSDLQDANMRSHFYCARRLLDALVRHCADGDDAAGDRPRSAASG